MKTKEEAIKYQTLDSSLHKVPSYFVISNDYDMAREEQIIVFI
jgi:hypothetical protein